MGSSTKKKAGGKKRVKNMTTEEQRKRCEDKQLFYNPRTGRCISKRPSTPAKKIKNMTTEEQQKRCEDKQMFYVPRTGGCTSKAPKKKIKNMTKEEQQQRCDNKQMFYIPRTGGCTSSKRTINTPPMPQKPKPPRQKPRPRKKKIVKPPGVSPGYLLGSKATRIVKNQDPTKANVTKHTLPRSFDPVVRQDVKIAMDATSPTFITKGMYGMAFLISANSANDVLSTINNGKKDALTTFYQYVPPYTSVLMKKQVGRVPNEVSVIYNEQRILETLQGLSFIPTLYGSAVYTSGMRKQVKLFKHVIFMEYIDGVTLHTVLHYDRASYDLDKIKSQLNTALIEMWKRGIMHLDFHDKNILVTKDSDIYIIDFGISTETDQTKDIAKDFSLDNDATDLWKTKLEKYGDSRIVQYNPTANPMWYNPNGKLLQYVKTL